MPRETVYGRPQKTFGLTTSDSLVVKEYKPVVDVIWHKDQGIVQVASMDQSAGPIVLRAPRKVLDQITVVDGANLITCGAGSTGSNGTFEVDSIELSQPNSGGATIDITDEWSMMSVCQGYHVELDRQGINALIRKLRRARDEAFGKDE